MHVGCMQGACEAHVRCMWGAYEVHALLHSIEMQVAELICKI